MVLFVLRVLVDYNNIAKNKRMKKKQKESGINETFISWSS